MDKETPTQSQDTATAPVTKNALLDEYMKKVRKRMEHDMCRAEYSAKCSEKGYGAVEPDDDTHPFFV